MPRYMVTSLPTLASDPETKQAPTYLHPTAARLIRVSDFTSSPIEHDPAGRVPNLIIKSKTLCVTSRSFDIIPDWTPHFGTTVRDSRVPEPTNGATQIDSCKMGLGTFSRSVLGSTPNLQSRHEPINRGSHCCFAVLGGERRKRGLSMLDSQQIR